MINISSHQVNHSANDGNCFPERNVVEVRNLLDWMVLYHRQSHQAYQDQQLEEHGACDHHQCRTSQKSHYCHSQVLLKESANLWSDAVATADQRLQLSVEKRDGLRILEEDEGLETEADCDEEFSDEGDCHYYFNIIIRVFQMIYQCLLSQSKIISRNYRL